ncbi:MAG: hypothetical protein AMXMBFR8_31030 [Nevskiales bacterium]
MGSSAGAAGARPIPAVAGIGLRALHHAEFLRVQPATGWVEVHSENFFADGGADLELLEQVRSAYPLSCHGVGLSLGSTDPLDAEHLRRLARLVRRFEPALVSEHCSFSSVDGRFVNDLLPLPYTEEALAHMVSRVGQVQEILGREILIENPSSYFEYNNSVIPEWEFLAELSRRSGCGLLLDVNNVYVSSCNNGFDAAGYLSNVPGERVGEIHLAGFSIEQFGHREILVDTHSARVHQPVWQLYDLAIRLFGRVPTLIEWDLELPALDVLVAEARHAEAVMEARDARVA